MEAIDIFKLVIGYLVPTLLGSLITYTCTQIKRNQNKDKAIEEAVQALLRNELIRRYRECKEKGELSILDKENIEAMFNQYKNLGGNGTVKHLIDEIIDSETKIIT